MKEKSSEVVYLGKLLKPEIEDLIRKKEWDVLKESIKDLEPVDIADIISEVEPNKMPVLFLILPRDLQSKVFSELNLLKQEILIKKLGVKEVKTLLKNLAPDDRTELLEGVSPVLTRKLIKLLPPRKRQETLELLGYPVDSVGRLMTSNYVAIQRNWTVSKAMKHIREWGLDAETINVVYVVDNEWRLVDDIPIRRLLLAKPEQKIETIMDGKFISINAYADQEEAIKLIQRYNLAALPVVDNENHLLGIVTFDDIIDVLREEQTEDVTRIGGIRTKSTELNVLTDLKNAPLSKIYKSRIRWLILLIFINLITGGIIQFFEETIAKYVILVTFLPVLIDTAGNAGEQASTLTIRALTLGTVKTKDWFYLIGKELLNASLLGGTAALAISIIGLLRGGSLKIIFIVGLSMALNITIGSLIGISLPIIFTKLKKDPATACGPLITTIADICGTAIYFTLSTIFL